MEIQFSTGFGNLHFCLRLEFHFPSFLNSRYTNLWKLWNWNFNSTIFYSIQWENSHSYHIEWILCILCNNVSAWKRMLFNKFLVICTLKIKDWKPVPCNSYEWKEQHMVKVTPLCNNAKNTCCSIRVDKEGRHSKFTVFTTIKGFNPTTKYNTH